ncbi:MULTISPECIES: hypothetical protein [unclassified Diaminobutyricimonas]|uniref:hypothetical protein n=1 Tax=unclassified Diaminobutyricimonas TaxID=2643261 RepID=UPI0012F4D8BE|nr:MULTISPECIES: hypothetical protein [unclassified Diaminobutyricimonas]
MSDVATQALAPAPRQRTLTAVIVALFALLYGWDLWEAAETIIVAPPTFIAAGQAVPWTAFIASAVVPVAVFALALVLGRKRRLFDKAALLLAGLCLVAVLTLSLTAYVRAGGL